MDTDHCKTPKQAISFLEPHQHIIGDMNSILQKLNFDVAEIYSTNIKTLAETLHSAPAGSILIVGPNNKMAQQALELTAQLEIATLVIQRTITSFYPIKHFQHSNSNVVLYQLDSTPALANQDVFFSVHFSEDIFRKAVDRAYELTKVKPQPPPSVAKQFFADLKS